MLANNLPADELKICEEFELLFNNYKLTFYFIGRGRISSWEETEA